jgi:hypothetical protein
MFISIHLSIYPSIHLSILFVYYHWKDEAIYFQQWEKHYTYSITMVCLVGRMREKREINKEERREE